MTQAPETEAHAAEPSAETAHPPEAAAIATGDAAQPPDARQPPDAAQPPAPTQPPDAAPPAPEPLKKTPLHALHVARGARMVPFAGYDMPVQYADGIIAEHKHVRAEAGLFDVSHMGQAFLAGADHETVARALETLVPGDIVGLAPGRQRYTQLLNDDGGILDDLMVTRSADPAEDGVLFLVVNAATKEADFAHLLARLPAGVRLLRADHRALLALQGPAACARSGGIAPTWCRCRS